MFFAAVYISSVTSRRGGVNPPRLSRLEGYGPPRPPFVVARYELPRRRHWSPPGARHVDRMSLGPWEPVLLDLDGGPDLVELLLDVGRLLLGDALLDHLGRAVHEVLGLLQAEARDLADDLDHVDLLVARRGQVH